MAAYSFFFFRQFSPLIWLSGSPSQSQCVGATSSSSLLSSLSSSSSSSLSSTLSLQLLTPSAAGMRSTLPAPSEQSASSAKVASSQPSQLPSPYQDTVLNGYSHGQGASNSMLRQQPSNVPMKCIPTCSLLTTRENRLNASADQERSSISEPVLERSAAKVDDPPVPEKGQWAEMMTGLRDEIQPEEHRIHPFAFRLRDPRTALKFIPRPQHLLTMSLQDLLAGRHIIGGAKQQREGGSVPHRAVSTTTHSSASNVTETISTPKSQRRANEFFHQIVTAKQREADGVQHSLQPTGTQTELKHKGQGDLPRLNEVADLEALTADLLGHVQSAFKKTKLPDIQSLLTLLSESITTEAAVAALASQKSDKDDELSGQSQQQASDLLPLAANSQQQQVSRDTDNTLAVQGTIEGADNVVDIPQAEFNTYIAANGKHYHCSDENDKTGGHACMLIGQTKPRDGGKDTSAVGKLDRKETQPQQARPGRDKKTASPGTSHVQTRGQAGNRAPPASKPPYGIARQKHEERRRRLRLSGNANENAGKKITLVETSKGQVSFQTKLLVDSLLNDILAEPDAR
eukprot:scpid35170/ scgid29568/ 